MRTARCLLPCLLLGLFAFGCGDGYIKAKGRVLKGGAPFHPGDGEALRIIFVPVDPPTGSKFDSYAGEFHADDGTFQIKGKDGKGLPPGKYRVSLELLKKKEDLFKGSLTGPSSPFTCEVTSSSNEVVVDLDQAKGNGEQQPHKTGSGRREER